MSKEQQEFKIEEINKPTPKQSEQKTKELSQFLGKSWNYNENTK